MTSPRDMEDALRKIVREAESAQHKTMLSMQTALRQIAAMAKRPLPLKA